MFRCDEEKTHNTESKSTPSNEQHSCQPRDFHWFPSFVIHSLGKSSTPVMMSLMFRTLRNFAPLTTPFIPLHNVLNTRLNYCVEIKKNFIFTGFRIFAEQK